MFAFWAIWLLSADLVNLFWIVMPAAFSNRIPEWTGDPLKPLPEALVRVYRQSEYL